MNVLHIHVIKSNTSGIEVEVTYRSGGEILIGQVGSTDESRQLATSAANGSWVNRSRRPVITTLIQTTVRK